MMSFEIFRHPQAVDLVDQFCRWLVDTRNVSYGTVTGYNNSILNLIQFAIAEIHEETDEVRDGMQSGSRTKSAIERW